MRASQSPKRPTARAVLPADLPKDWFPFFSAERIATLKRLLQAKHPWMQFVAEMANREGAYNDRGQWKVLMHFATGEKRWARQAIEQLLKIFHAEPPSLNDTREEAIYWPLNYVWLQRHMTPQERQTYRQRMRTWCEHINGKQAEVKGRPNFGTRLSDSDVTVGHYFGFLLTLAATRDEPLVDDLIDGIGPTGSTLADQKQAIERFCAQAEGGEWIESSAYNQGTLSLAFLGASALGIGNFPGLAKLGRDLARNEAFKLTPDFQDAAEWGDESWPRDPERWARMALMALLVGAGLDTEGQARKLIDDLTRGVPIYPTYWLDLHRALWVFDPSSPVPAVPPSYGFRHFQVGLAVLRTKNQLLAVFGPGRPGVDHDVPHGADVRWYCNGSWVVDHPMGYEPHVNVANAGSPAGLGKMWNARIVAAKGDDTTCEVVWETSGPATWPEYFDPPAPFLKSYRRTVQFDATAYKLAVTDVFDGSPPERLPKFDRYYADVQKQIQGRSALWVVRWHTPTEPKPIDHGYRWTNPSGQTIELTHDAPRTRVVKVSKENVHGYLNDTERAGWMIELLADTPQATLRSWLGPAGRTNR